MSPPMNEAVLRVETRYTTVGRQQATGGRLLYHARMTGDRPHSRAHSYGQVRLTVYVRERSSSVASIHRQQADFFGLYRIVYEEAEASLTLTINTYDTETEVPCLAHRGIELWNPVCGTGTGTVPTA